MRRKWTDDNLPEPDDLSLEVLYAWMISAYGDDILQDCPQLATIGISIPLVNNSITPAAAELKNHAPVERKLANLIKKVLSKENWTYALKLDDSTTLEELLDQFKKCIKEKTVGSNTRKKFRHLVKALEEAWPKKEMKWILRRRIKEFYLGSNSDYRTEPTLERKFFKALSSTLNRLKSDITVANNGTIRNPRMHVTFDFLRKRDPELGRMDNAALQTQYEILDHTASLIQQARSVGYFKSDWKNHLSRRWNQLRSDLIRVARNKIREENMGEYDNTQQAATDVLIPPPVQFELALDLYPPSIAFSFTCGRRQGYAAFEDQYSDSVDWFFQFANWNERQYFIDIMQNVPSRLQVLAEIPEEIRHSETEKDLINKLDNWFKNEGKDSAVAKATSDFIDSQFEALPKFLHKKVTGHTLKKASAIALFFAIFEIGHPEDVYLDHWKLKIPAMNPDLLKSSRKDAETTTGFGGNQLKTTTGFGGNQLGQWMFSGPSGMGGFNYGVLHTQYKPSNYSHLYPNLTDFEATCLLSYSSNNRGRRGRGSMFW
eukprot:CAMPEP_0115042516 /NCGR_PEP_ID=MMETSP0216-20121206/46310_1 /TAXON_ID=223996 /ORGANISM="Protocruzia adherens, Strain Boccale" /LENGTH=543 /DNA_ID=CAMNT_0002424641 /DNA_START=430 /DNA_END=2061 /DNA_ORIENTATION=+